MWDEKRYKKDDSTVSKAEIINYKSIKFINMSSPVNKTESVQTQTNQDTIKGTNKSQDPTAKGFATKSQDDKESTKPDPEYTAGKIRGD